MSIFKDIASWDEGTWVGTMAFTVLVGAIAISITAIITCERTPLCSAWASDEPNGGAEFTGDEFKQRYDACMQERRSTPTEAP